jgi:putative colanic acid biosynthesis acetyltransferase WcaF
MNSSAQVDLSRFDNSGFDRGRPLLHEIAWRVVSAVCFQCPLSLFYAPKRLLLRLFGAKIGCGVCIKPRVTITFPWKLSIGNHSWIGEEVFLDSLDRIEIGSNVCISQRAYLCTGSHDSRSAKFDLITKPIRVGDGAWIAAGAMIAPGVSIGSRALVRLGSVVTEDVPEDAIVGGNPALFTKTRVIEARL